MVPPLDTSYSDDGFGISPLLLKVWFFKQYYEHSLEACWKCRTLALPKTYWIYILTSTSDDSFMYLTLRSTDLDPLHPTYFQAPKSTKPLRHRTVVSFLYFPTCQSFPWLSRCSGTPKSHTPFWQLPRIFPSTTGPKDWIPSLLFRRTAFTELLTETLTRHWCYIFSV